jgi:hypothetical protein
VINRPLVVSDTIEGETIILHHGTGRYFDTAETGAYIWRQLDAGLSPRLIAHRLATGGTALDVALEAVGAFVAELTANDLVSQAPSGPLPVEDDVPPPLFSRPSLGIHTDLADMLLLDPIHDVGPGGWPTRPLTDPQASSDAA